ncbi:MULTISPECIES: monovalent cation/H+ antiporter subunit A [Rhodobacterales]|uniref:monovalent cation/H+ antiporter subunit A n=1 Tax=Rhodobacterales TaxID=204455 RepID=UPI00237FAE39|nr:monovalent cation/H+ antiporter subunit A [Phaeobacter gallaeciensis]MDE4139708.1 monovalent cation/H+ antiporter subunit A [Phaeobacter gallaeciensis]MDE4147234.1 monovalent cation/H+ antiporter subunit A [Phaeobacter gallaeciensis]MDE4151453.1 monovalent cation/H+ antiporter subunit A [Phaeobacter gallaeciensis]MDE4227763.1 monovalent cation/H+ antiporter subunit A [Phaeobacter gallaeciensis]MDE4255917.1 monovalent cation/H+ antiporter subunit A [Phaeobacter gallaeciensis]
MSLFLIAALPFLGAVFPALLIRAGRNASASAAGLTTFLALTGLLLHAPAVFRGEVITATFDWLPGLGLNANFFLDGLGFLFATLILGIGMLIILYARFYLSREDPMGQFYTYLLLFQGAMVGIVLSDNILLLLVFWELTSLSSFLLIGYWKHLPEGRQGARMALTVTGSGGLAMIGGMLILGNIVGSYDLSVILENKDLIQASPLYLPALILILLGCFTKSAQFPFHFWLPHAMAAPTPVSAYLHSATMVKAGLFLMARMWPVLAGTPEWFYIVATTGLVTMLIGAVIALFKDDLKGLLAFSTVSHLGLITMLLGFGTKIAAVAAVFHIINHATFKAALFMSAGIVDHEAHTRDIKRLGGLRHLMPVTFTIAFVAALSMAGIPPFNGFLSKEMMLEETVHTVWAGSHYLVPGLALIAALFSAAYSFRFIVHVFFGPKRDDYPAHPHDPGAGMWLAPAFLITLVVLIGLFSAKIAGPLVAVAAGAVIGGEELPYYSLKLWHGLTPALYMSLVAVGGGGLLLALHKPLMRAWNAAPRPEAKDIFDALMAVLARLAKAVTDGLHNGSITRYGAVMISFTVAISWYAYSTGTTGPATRSLQEIGAIPALGWLSLVLATLLIVARHRNRLLALVLIGVVGLVVSMSFNYLSAPDLALTQLSVEVVTIVLMLLALNFMPKETPVETPALIRLRDGAIAVVAGLGAGGLIYALMTRDFAAPSISEFHLANSYKGGGGTNVVNVILVDFRGFDTFGEIIVLGIAALVIYALTEAVLGTRVRAYLLNRKPDLPQAGDAHPMMMVVATRVMMPLALMVAAYIFFRGHNLPGGGFIAGLIAAIAVIMQYMASGFAWTSERQRFYYHGIIGSGVLIAAATGIGAWFNDMPFLTSAFGYIHWPPLKEFEWATAALFDLGVFLAVVGAVLLALESLSRFAWQPGISSEYAMDINPARDDEPKNENEV